MYACMYVTIILVRAYLEMVDEPETDDDHDVPLQSAISASLQDNNDHDDKRLERKLLSLLATLFLCTSDRHDVAEILRTHSLLNVSTCEACRVKVRRTHIWIDSVKVFRRVDLKKTLKVTFIGEAGVDDGGPRREYLRLMMSAMSDQNDLLDGPKDRRVLRHNLLSAEKGHFYIMGCFIVLSLTQGGPAPGFFAPSVVDYLVGGCVNVHPCIGDIPDFEVHDKLKKV